MVMNIRVQVKARLFNLAQKINQHKDGWDNGVIPFNRLYNEPVIFAQFLSEQIKRLVEAHKQRT